MGSSSLEATGVQVARVATVCGCGAGRKQGGSVGALVGEGGGEGRDGAWECRWLRWQVEEESRGDVIDEEKRSVLD